MISLDSLSKGAIPTHMTSVPSHPIITIGSKHTSITESSHEVLV
jgi:hypothetical protein